MEKVKITPSLCWSCKNAVPKIRDGKYICGCSWSKDFQPVEGWTAEKHIKKRIRLHGCGWGHGNISCA